MRDSLEAGVRRFASGWWLWALVLLALPNCGFDGVATGTFHPVKGELPHSSAIMCDIEKYQGATRRCATAQDLMIGIPVAHAAEALVSGQPASNVGLEYSPSAEAVCGVGHPRAIDFQGPFPDGLAVCLNCGVMPTPYPNAAAVCAAQCRYLVDPGDAPVPPDIPAFCTANAHPSTYFPSSGCFNDACSAGGTLRPDFADPRRIPEPVVWRDLILANAVGSNLTQTGPTTTGDVFNAGAVSEQWVDQGDAYVEFEAERNQPVPHCGIRANARTHVPSPAPTLLPVSRTSTSRSR